MKLLLSISVWTILLVCGCQKSPDHQWLKTHPAVGTITINGQPAVGAVVRLFPVEVQAGTLSPVVPTGVVREDGSFELTSYHVGDGGPEGEYRVTLEWPDPKLLQPQFSMTQDPPDRLKKRFSIPEKSAIKRRITAGENHLEPIVLEKVEILSGSSLQ